MIQFVVASALALAGVGSAINAVVNERRMQEHRLPGVSYSDVTFRRDGAWRRSDLFDEEGLAFQKRAARSGMVAAMCWILAIVAWSVLAAW